MAFMSRDRGEVFFLKYFINSISQLSHPCSLISIGTKGSQISIMS